MPHQSYDKILIDHFSKKHLVTNTHVICVCYIIVTLQFISILQISHWSYGKITFENQFTYSCDLLLCAGPVTAEEDPHLPTTEEGAEGVVTAVGVATPDLGRGHALTALVSSLKVEEIRYCMISPPCFMSNLITLVIWNHLIS